MFFLKLIPLRPTESLYKTCIFDLTTVFMQIKSAKYLTQPPHIPARPLNVAVTDIHIQLLIWSVTLDLKVFDKWMYRCGKDTVND